MFNETSYSDFDTLGKTPTEAEVKAAVAGCLPQWKAAGRPQNVNFCATGGSGLTAQPGVIVTTLPPPGLPSATGGADIAPAQTPSDTGGGFMDTIGGIFSNIPPTLLYVGGAVVLFMILKKR